MVKHIGFIHAIKGNPFSPPKPSGHIYLEYHYYYQRGYRQVTGKQFNVPAKLAA